MQRSDLIRIVLFWICTVFIFLNSCSSKVSKLPYQQPEKFLSPKYEDLYFENVSMDICYPTLDFDNPPEAADTVHINNMKEFDEAFKKYFLDGIKIFSSISNPDWIFYKPDYDMQKDLIEYWTKTKDGSDFYVIIDSTLAFFRKESKSDFLMTFEMISYRKIPADSSKPNSKYASVIDLHYLIWDRQTGDLITKEEVTSKTEFDRLTGKWPYRAAIIKSAALIFEKLPMFEK